MFNNLDSITRKQKTACISSNKKLINHHMKKIFFSILFLSFLIQVNAQFGAANADTSWKQEYRATPPITFTIKHTKLEVRFDFDKSYLYGKEWLTVAPHFYATDSIILDAKGMDFNKVAITKGKDLKDLKYKYDGNKLRITLDRLYTKNETLVLYFDYVSKPDEVEAEGSAAITDAKGLYFINPKGEDKNKPTQVWTQGETEANSVWMVTIDKPNQKTTQEIYMTVPQKFVTLSNGLKISEKKNTDGTRTDYWKQDLPHAPYLFFMGVGDYAVIKDKPYKGKEVSYYVKPDQAPYAKGVFGNTPEMLAFFSEKLGVDYPWAKYAQIVGQDYVSGAMENTTATLHQDGAYQNNRELLDGNNWEETIAHELFHHWFGDLVTAESWSNLTVNESFANYSEYLWDEYKYGKDFADAHNFEDMTGYLMSGSADKDLVRYHYSNKEDMFDAVSYNKGGRILHMLRNYVGDDAFFASLKLYLETHKFKTGEAAQLRLAFEEVTGQDLNWFWNQWFYGSGHPELTIDYNYDLPGIPNTAEVIVKQTQKSGKIFKIPVAIDVYTAGNKERYQVWLTKAVDTFYFNSVTKPELINVDADKILLTVKKDNKSEENYIAQWKYAKNYLDRREALDFFSKKRMPEIAKGLYDKFAGLRLYAIQKLGTSAYNKDKVALEEIERIAKTDRDKKTRAAAINFLAKTGDKKYLPIFETAVNDSSYSVAGAALNGLTALDANQAYSLAKQYSVNAKGALETTVTDILMEKGTEADFEIIANAFKNAPLSQSKIMGATKFANYLATVNNLTQVKKGIDYIIEFRNQIPTQYRSYVDPAFKAAFDKIVKAKGEEIEKYVIEVFK